MDAFDSKENTSNKKTTISNTSDAEFPTSKAVATALALKVNTSDLPNASVDYANRAGNALTADSAGYATSAGSASGANYSNHLQAFTADNFTGGDHFIKVIRDTEGWGMRLYACYNNDISRSDQIRVGYADSAESMPVSNFIRFAQVTSKSDVRVSVDNSFVNKLCIVHERNSDSASTDGGMYNNSSYTVLGVYFWQNSGRFAEYFTLSSGAYMTIRLGNSSSSDTAILIFVLV
jgi:hypothetical protein